MAGIELEGMRRFRKELKAVQGNLDDLKNANQEVGQKIADAAKSRATGLGSTAGKAAPSIKSNRAAASATVKVGGARAPYGPGAELGSKKFRQFKPWRGAPSGDIFSGNAGYFLFPAIRDQKDVVIELYWSRIEEIAGKAFKT